MTTSAARRLWPAFETYHAHIYFVPEAAEAYRALGQYCAAELARAVGTAAPALKVTPGPGRAEAAARAEGSG